MRNSSLTVTLRSNVKTIRTDTGAVLVDPERVLPNVTVRQLTRSDVIKSPVREGFRPPLPYSATGSTTGYGFIDIRADYVGSGKVPYTSVYSGNTAASSTTSLVVASTQKSLISQSDINRSVIGMLNRIGDQKWSAGEALAELMGSLEQITRTANRLSRALVFASQKKWGRVARELGVAPIKLGQAAKNSSSGFLSYVFGWQPMVEDIAHAMLLLSGYGRTDRLIISASSALQSSSGLQFVKNGDCSEFDNNTSQTLGQRYAVYEEFTDEWKASVYYEVRIGKLRDLQAYGLIGLSTPWAVVPLSFLYDWVLPIGDFLSALDATVGLSYLGGSYTRFKKARREHRPRDHIFYPYAGRIEGGIIWSEGTKFEMNRTVWPNSPLPFPAYVKNPLSPFKAAVATALLAQRIGQLH